MVESPRIFSRPSRSLSESARVVIVGWVGETSSIGLFYAIGTQSFAKRVANIEVDKTKKLHIISSPRACAAPGQRMSGWQVVHLSVRS